MMPLQRLVSISRSVVAYQLGFCRAAGIENCSLALSLLSCGNLISSGVVMSRMLRRIWMLIACCCFGSYVVAQEQEPFIPRAQSKPPGPALSPAEALAKMKV